MRRKLTETTRERTPQEHAHALSHADTDLKFVMVKFAHTEPM